MGTAHDAPDVLLWKVAEHPIAIECPAPLLEEINGEVQDGFRRLSRGGVEVGGILFGRRTASTIRILAWRPIVCEHSRGAAFLLSNTEVQNLVGQLEAAQGDPHLKVLEPVGWFVSHTRAGLRMTPDDLEIFNRFFQESWQVTLVCHPERNDSTKAGFFVRDRDGRVNTESSYRVFPIEGTREAKPASLNPTSDPAMQGASSHTASHTEHEPRFSGGHRRIAYIVTALMLGAIALFAVPKLRNANPATEPLQLRLVDSKGQLRLEWERTSATILSADGATLYINDGAPQSPVDVDRDTLKAGSVTYARMTEDVSVRMVVRRKGMDPFQELARYVGPPIARIQAKELREARDGTEKILTETTRLRDELRQEARRTQELERSLRKLETVLERETRTKNLALELLNNAR